MILGRLPDYSQRAAGAVGDLDGSVHRCNQPLRRSSTVETNNNPSSRRMLFSRTGSFYGYGVPDEKFGLDQLTEQSKHDKMDKKHHQHRAPERSLLARRSASMSFISPPNARESVANRNALKSLHQLFGSRQTPATDEPEPEPDANAVEEEEIHSNQEHEDESVEGEDASEDDDSASAYSDYSASSTFGDYDSEDESESGGGPPKTPVPLRKPSMGLGYQANSAAPSNNDLGYGKEQKNDLGYGTNTPDRASLGYEDASPDDDDNDLGYGKATPDSNDLGFGASTPAGDNFDPSSYYSTRKRNNSMNLLQGGGTNRSGLARVTHHSRRRVTMQHTVTTIPEPAPVTTPAPSQPPVEQRKKPFQFFRSKSMNMVSQDDNNNHEDDTNPNPSEWASNSHSNNNVLPDYANMGYKKATPDRDALGYGDATPRNDDLGYGKAMPDSEALGYGEAEPTKIVFPAPPRRRSNSMNMLRQTSCSSSNLARVGRPRRVTMQHVTTSQQPRRPSVNFRIRRPSLTTKSMSMVPRESSSEQDETAKRASTTASKTERGRRQTPRCNSLSHGLDRPLSPVNQRNIPSSQTSGAASQFPNRRRRNSERHAIGNDTTTTNNNNSHHPFPLTENGSIAGSRRMMNRRTKSMAHLHCGDEATGFVTGSRIRRLDHTLGAPIDLVGGRKTTVMAGPWL